MLRVNDATVVPIRIDLTALHLARYHVCVGFQPPGLIFAFVCQRLELFRVVRAMKSPDSIEFAIEFFPFDKFANPTLCLVALEQHFKRLVCAVFFAQGA